MSDVLIMTPVKRSNYAKWFGQTRSAMVKIELRPKLDKWDVVTLPNKFADDRRWYMYQKTERFNTLLDAIKFVLKQFKQCELHLQDRFSTEVATYNLEDIEMTSKAVSKVTLIYGQDSRFVSDDQIFEHIKQIEDKINGLERIQNKPKKLSEKISGLKDDIKDLVEVVDNR